MLPITFLWLSGQLFYVHFTKHKIISKTPYSRFIDGLKNFVRGSDPIKKSLRNYESVVRGSDPINSFLLRPTDVIYSIYFFRGEGTYYGETMVAHKNSLSDLSEKLL